ncbi:hypothetical protein [Hyphomicrobium sp. 99]|uniref:hypothetical protein n=1 Tax=Hyphomicrobium sp. 99 TaxID=1163419 RepID=UPI003527DCA4
MNAAAWCAWRSAPEEIWAVGVRCRCSEKAQEERCKQPNRFHNMRTYLKTYLKIPTSTSGKSELWQFENEKLKVRNTEPQIKERERELR